jgi:hypothetical protein
MCKVKLDDDVWLAEGTATTTEDKAWLFHLDDKDQETCLKYWQMFTF